MSKRPEGSGKTSSDNSKGLEAGACWPVSETARRPPGWLEQSDRGEW